MADETSGSGTRSADEIRRDIERTRADMDETVDALGERLSPGRIVDELWSRFRQGDGLSGVGDVVRDHPIPLALMGLGLGWLAVEKATGRPTTERENVSAGTWAPAEGRRGPYLSDAVRHDDPDWVHTGTGTKIKSRLSEAGERISDFGERIAESVQEKAASVSERVGELKEKASDKSHHMQEDATDKVEHLKERTGEAAHRVADQTRERARSARQGFWNLMEDNPMVVGAIAFGVGLASGLAAPTTPVEDRLMGRASDTLKDEAKRMAEHTAESAKKVAHDAVDAAKTEVQRVREDEEGTARSAVEELKDAAKRVVDSATEAARESAEAEDLTPEAIAAEAKDAVAHTREAAKRPGGTTRRRSESKAGKTIT